MGHCPTSIAIELPQHSAMRIFEAELQDLIIPSHRLLNLLDILTSLGGTRFPRHAITVDLRGIGHRIAQSLDVRYPREYNRKTIGFSANIPIFLEVLKAILVHQNALKQIVYHTVAIRLNSPLSARD